ncbi:MAG: J domain-containing protein [Fimbriimonadales bacterium]
MSKPDYYAVLGVPRDADADEIKAAFRRQARKLHPDVNRDDPDAEEKFKELNEAYTVLSDPNKRAQFDQFGTVGDIPQGAGFSGGFGDIFDMFFGGFGGGVRGGPRVIHGRDLKTMVELSLQEVVTGSRRTLTLERSEVCSECNGNGCAAGKRPETCPDCDGSGVVTSIANTILGQIRQQSPCRRCGGEGSRITHPCPKCKGSKLIKGPRRIEINVPTGVEDGTVLHVPYQGDDGINGGNPGDLYVTVRVTPDSRFMRDELGVWTRCRLTVSQATLGADLIIAGIDGDIELHIPPGTQPGHEFRIHGKGVPKIGATKRGDLRVRTIVEIPTVLTDEERAVYESLQQIYHEQPSKKEGILDHIKKGFKGKK